MKYIIIFISLFAVLMAGCMSLDQSAVVTDGVIENTSLGFFGFTYNIPAETMLHHPSKEGHPEYDDVQQLALRVFELNESYHPRGNESFYESFLMLTDHVAFILVTLRHDSLPAFDRLSSDFKVAPEWQVLPLYNMRDFRQVSLGEARLDAFVASGNAFEKKGWYYSKSKNGRTEFSYKACKVTGAGNDSYILMGFSLAEDEDLLALKMQDMISGFRF
jgi:hypothetical protein